MRWLVAYSDGTFLCSDDYAPDQIPRNYVICIIQEERYCGKATLQHHNYYCWHKEGRWVPHDLGGLNQYLDDIREPGIRLQGYWVPHDEYEELIRKARADTRIRKATAETGEVPEQ